MRKEDFEFGSNETFNEKHYDVVIGNKDRGKMLAERLDFRVDEMVGYNSNTYGDFIEYEEKRDLVKFDVVIEGIRVLDGPNANFEFSLLDGLARPLPIVESRGE
ncbi:hypothetical protein GOBAR_DD04207 [Gossypium barbadense]|nr:hypothetical protein GOBAR_DD04207 [Gossypium barbadense]